MIQSIQHHLWNMVEQCDGMSIYGFQWHWVTGVYWWCDRGQKQPDEFWSVPGYTVCPDSVKWSKVDWTALHSTNGRWPKTYSKNNPGVFEGKNLEYSAMANSISWSQPDWACQLKSAAAKAWQSITKEETQSLVMSMSSRLKAVIACKGFSAKY